MCCRVGLAKNASSSRYDTRMETTHLLYLHGFRSSPLSAKAQKVAARVRADHALASGSYQVHLAAPDAAAALAGNAIYALRFANADNVVTGVQWQPVQGRLALGSTLTVQ